MYLSFIKTRLFGAAALSLIFSSQAMISLAHGGEDHGDQKPKSTASAKGVVTHYARVGDLEVMFKHPAITPDSPTTGRLFITQFSSNEPYKADPKLEIESASGMVTAVEIQPMPQGGAFNIKLPALPEGDYKVRATVSSEGKTETATFSSLQVKHAGAEDEQSGWFSTLTSVLIFGVVLAVLAALLYAGWALALAGSKAKDEAVSA